MQQAGEHLERGGLASAVRPEKADDLARLQVERDAVHGRHILGLAVNQALQRGQYAGFALADNVGLVQVAHMNGRWHGRLSLASMEADCNPRGQRQKRGTGQCLCEVAGREAVYAMPCSGSGMTCSCTRARNAFTTSGPNFVPDSA